MRTFYSSFFFCLDYSIILRLTSISAFIRYKFLAYSYFLRRDYYSSFYLSMRFFSAYSPTLRFSYYSYRSFRLRYSSALRSYYCLCSYLLRSIYACLSRCLSSMAFTSRSRYSLRFSSSASLSAFSYYFSLFSLDNLFSPLHILPPRPSPYFSFKKRDYLGNTEERERSRMVESTKV